MDVFYRLLFQLPGRYGFEGNVTAILQPGEIQNDDSAAFWDERAPAGETGEERIHRVVEALRRFYLSPRMGYSVVVDGAPTGDTPYFVVILGREISPPPPRPGDVRLAGPLPLPGPPTPPPGMYSSDDEPSLPSSPSLPGQAAAGGAEILTTPPAVREPAGEPVDWVDTRDEAASILRRGQPSPAATRARARAAATRSSSSPTPAHSSRTPPTDDLENTRFPFPLTEEALLEPLRNTAEYDYAHPEHIRHGLGNAVFAYHVGAGAGAPHVWNSREWFAAAHRYFPGARPNSRAEELALPPAEAAAHFLTHMAPARQQQLREIAEREGGMLVVAGVVRAALLTQEIDTILGHPEEISAQDEADWQDVVESITGDWADWHPEL